MAEKYQGKLSKDTGTGIVPLYEGAEQKSYYKFVTHIDHVPDEEVERVKGLVDEVDPSLPPMFTDRAVIQTDKYTPVPEGVYCMKDGTLFISCVTPTPNLTGEMVDWFIIWHQLDTLRYTIWNPEDHYGVKVSKKDHDRILDESLSIRERGWDITSNVLEAMNGEEPTWSALSFTEPAKVGFSNELIGTPKCQALLVANNVTKIGPLEIPIVMCEWLCENDEGKNEWVTAAWFGHGVKDGKDWGIHIPKPLMKKIATAFPSMYIVHSHKEMGHINEVLPALYAEQKDKPLDEGAESSSITE